MATLSQGQDEIFSKEYVPPIEHMRKVAPQNLMVSNADGLLDVPLALRDKKGKRSLRMATLSKEDKLKAQLMLMQDRAQRSAQKEQELLKEIERQAQKKAYKDKGLTQREMDLEETKGEVFKTLQMQAQEFITIELEKRDKERQAQMEEELQRRLSLALASQPSQASQLTNVEMIDTASENTREKTTKIGMGTRKNPVDFGRMQPNRIRNQSEMSYENENSMNTSTNGRY